MTRTHRCRRLVLLAAAAALIAGTAQGATLVVANKAAASVSLIDLEDGTVVATLPAGEGPHEVGISPDGRHALVTNYGRRDTAGNSLTLIDIPAAEVVKTIDLGAYTRPHGVEWLDERHAAVTIEDSRALAVVDVDAGQVTRTIDTDHASPTWSPSTAAPGGPTWPTSARAR
jgi:DNA-binding beta-propeller fold protein YncE